MFLGKVYHSLMWCVCGMLIYSMWSACTQTSPSREQTKETSSRDAGRERTGEQEPHVREAEPTPEPSLETTPPETITTVQQICQEIARQTCPAFFQCCSSFSLKYSSLSDCIQKLTTSCDELAYKKERMALAKDLAYISQEQLSRCLRALTQTKETCTIAPQEVTERACKGIIQDRAKVGESCKSDIASLHCAGNTGICFPEPTGMPCKRWSPAGTACADGPCEPGLYCDISTSTTGICKAPAAKGQPCRAPAHCQEGLACLNKRCTDPLDGGSSCDNVRQCKTGFACDGSQKQCVAIKKPGEPCSFPLHCGPHGVCKGLASTTLCQKGKSEGTACTQNFECAPGLHCPQQTCTPLPKAGETCASAGCYLDLTCDRTTNKCAKLPIQGQACLNAKVKCATGLVCINASCQPPGQKAAPCQDDEECEPGVYGCGNSGTCEPLPTLGEACFRDVLCERSVVCDLPTKRCVPRKKQGEACPLGFECELSLACVSQADGIKRCAPIPKAGERCSTTCDTGLQCRPGILQGTCIPAICNGAIQ